MGREELLSLGRQKPSVPDSSQDRQSKREECYFLPLSLGFKAKPEFLAKCSLSDSATWCRFRAPILQITVVRTRGSKESDERRWIDEERVKTTRERSLGVSALSGRGDFADAPVSLEE